MAQVLVGCMAVRTLARSQPSICASLSMFGPGPSSPATSSEAGAVAKMADGVVVGSALVRLIETQPSDAQVESFARELRQGMKRQDTDQ